MENDPSDPMKKYFVDLRGRGALELMKDRDLEPGSLLAVRSATRLAALWEELLGFGMQLQAVARRGAVLTLELITVAIAQERIESGSSGRARATFDRCQNYMGEHFRTVKTIDDIAHACHLDVAYMCRLYRRFIGEPPYRVLQRLQMGWAADQLLESGALVREVADGLDIDPFQLSRTFKRVYGVSPTEFLKLRTG